MTYVFFGLVQLLGETWDRCREATVNPETGKYSEVVVRLTGLCVKTT